ncbi:hypothetical protein B0H19DRAFT_1243603 [Mycena capillaripes]|nr:hypothetical protein B0H19DRAFT_1243603 [Mycena capillaripes]
MGKSATGAYLRVIERPFAGSYEASAAPSLRLQNQPFLKEQGYMLRRRYRPDWVPESLVLEKDPLVCEDLIGTCSEVLDATRILDVAQVVLKMVKTDLTEVGISTFLTNESAKSYHTGPRGHPNVGLRFGREKKCGESARSNLPARTISSRQRRRDVVGREEGLDHVTSLSQDHAPIFTGSDWCADLEWRTLPGMFAGRPPLPPVDQMMNTPTPFTFGNSPVSSGLTLPLMNSLGGGPSRR